MGNASYNFESRQLRATTLDYASVHQHDTRVFKQNALRKVNEGMDPCGISLRESRDSVLHPCTVPIVLQLDVTGSMGRHPADLVKGDLPHLMGNLIEGECPHAAILFMAVGDLFNDKAPLQIGQFESGDAELDHWLTHTWLEGDGGGNRGESYALGWLFAHNMIVTDAWEKRGQKGLFISIGDEPIHEENPVGHLRQLFCDQFGKVTEGLEFGSNIESKAIYDVIKPKWNIHHIQVGPRRYDNHERSWNFLTDGYHEIGRNAPIVDKVRDIIRSHMATLPAFCGESEEYAGAQGDIYGEQASEEMPAPHQPVGAGGIPDPI